MADLPAGFVIQDVTPSSPPPPSPKDVPEGFQIEKEPTLGEKFATLGEELVSGGKEYGNIGQELVSGIAEDVKKREQAKQETLVAMLRQMGGGEGISPREAAVQYIGQGAGGMLDIMGETFNAAARGASLLIPPTVEKPVVDNIAKGWNYLRNTDVGEYLADAVRGGVRTYTDWKEKNPQDAKTLESAVNIAAVVAPVKTKVKADPTKSSLLEKASEALSKSAAGKELARRTAFVKDLIMPKRTAKVAAEQVSRTTQEGLLKRNVVQPSRREVDIMEEVAKLDVSPKYSLQKNYNLINKANENLAKQLKADVAKSTAKIPATSTNTIIDDAVNDLIQSNPVIVGNAETTAKRVANKAKEIVASKPETPSGLLEARKEFDSWVKSQKGDAIFDPASENVLSISVRKVRQTMNDVLDANVTSTKVKEELRRQSLLYDALDNIGPKAATEYSTSVGRLWQNASKVVQFKANANKELALLFGMSAVGAAGYFMPFLTGTLLVTSAGVGAYKGVTSPAVKKGLAKLIAMSDKAIKTTKNPEMLKQLRVDRAAAMELLKNLEVEINGEKEKELQ